MFRSSRKDLINSKYKFILAISKQNNQIEIVEIRHQLELKRKDHELQTLKLTHEIDKLKVQIQFMEQFHKVDISSTQDNVDIGEILKLEQSDDDVSHIGNINQSSDLI